jgi:molybdenum cofactor cytidylyltransferase
MNHLALILLAAGQGSRFGGGKLAALLQGRPLVMHAAQNLAHMPSPAGRFAVVAPDTPPLTSLGFEQVLLDPPGAPLSRSLALGVARAAQAGAQAVLIALGDMPLVPAGHLRDLLHHFNGDRIATQVGDHRQPPAIFGARHFPDLIALSGDRGAGALLRDAPALPLGGNAGLDVDTRGDLTRAEHACLSPDPR